MLKQRPNQSNGNSAGQPGGSAGSKATAACAARSPSRWRSAVQAAYWMAWPATMYQVMKRALTKAPA